jgi:hypothetical protein
VTVGERPREEEGLSEVKIGESKVRAVEKRWKRRVAKGVHVTGSYLHKSDSPDDLALPFFTFLILLHEPLNEAVKKNHCRILEFPKKKDFDSLWRSYVHRIS